MKVTHLGEKLFHKRGVLLLMQVLQTGLYKLCHLPSRMGEHGVGYENMENTENLDKMENINQMT